MKVLHDYRCTECNKVTEHFLERGQDSTACPRCGGHAVRVFLQVAKPHWSALAQGSSASPEAIDRFERLHKQQRDKELRSMREHGDYGPRPGAD